VSRSMDSPTAAGATAGPAPRRVVVVTGAASGIGVAIATSLAAEGDAVVAVDLAQAVLDLESGLLRPVIADVATPEGVAAAIRVAWDAFGRLDGFVANAGIAGRGRAEDLAPEDWDRVMSVNARSVYLAAREAIPLMRAGGGGSFVAVASQLGLVGGRGMVAYAASKGAVVNLVRSLALDHSHEGVRVNCVCPGPTMTPMLEASLAAGGEGAAGLVVGSVPLGRVGRPEEIASVVRYLLSPEASFVAGAIWAADGGYIAQ